ncbi:MAG: hypothetical protein ACLVBP_15840 [Ruminococcus sp.]
MSRECPVGAYDAIVRTAAGGSIPPEVFPIRRWLQNTVDIGPPLALAMHSPYEDCTE